MSKKVAIYLLVTISLCLVMALSWPFKQRQEQSYDQQIEYYREGLLELSRKNSAASIAAFERVEEPRIMAREYFLYHKAQAYRAAVNMVTPSTQETRRYAFKALDCLERAHGLKSNKELTRLIENDIRQQRRWLAEQLVPTNEHQETFSLLADIARHDSVDTALITQYLTTQLNIGENSGAEQTAKEYASQLLKPSVMATFPPNQQSFIKQHAVIQKQKQESETLVSAPYAAAIRSTKSTIAAGHEILNYLISSPLLGEKQYQRFAKAVAGSYVALKNKETPASAAGRIFVTEVESKWEKLPPPIQQGMIDLLWREGFFSFASKINQRLITRYPDGPMAESLVFNGGRLFQDLGDHKKALTMFLRYLAQGRGSEHYEESLFQAAWSNYQLADKNGLPLFARYREEFPHGSHETGALFFQMRLMAKLGYASDRIASVQKELMSHYPLSFYTILTRHQLHMKEPVADDLFAASSDQIEKFRGAQKPTGISIQDQVRLLKYDELKKVGATSFGEWELGDIPYDAGAPAFMYAIAYSIQSTENIYIRLNLLTRLVQKDDSFHKAVALKDLFPNLYEKEIRGALTHANLSTPALLISSLIRQESAFHSRAESTKKATGLMQLIGSTAQAHARAAGYDPERIDLFDPEENIRLGVATISRLLLKYPGKLHYALAGYNAGEEALNRWVKARSNLEPLDFIETIPYKETRIYVAAILRNYLIYSNLYDHQTLDSSMAKVMESLGGT